MNQGFARTARDLRINILAGLITIAPLFVTYLVFSFLLGILAKAGLPVVWLLAWLFPNARFDVPWVQFVLSILLTLVVLYLVGRVTSEFAGQKAFELFESTIKRVPMVEKIYGSVRQLVDNMTAQKSSTQRVVLVEFPIAGQKCIGFLSKTMIDSVTGEEVAAVLLPNAINPTSAFLQLLPLRFVIETDVTMEQAMSMLLTGGAVGPETLRFYNPGKLAPGAHPSEETIAEVTEITIVTECEPATEQTPPTPEPPVFPPVERPVR